jgi:hypothetical protein
MYAEKLTPERVASSVMAAFKFAGILTVVVAMSPRVRNDWISVRLAPAFTRSL